MQGFFIIVVDALASHEGFVEKNKLETNSYTCFSDVVFHVCL